MTPSRMNRPLALQLIPGDVLDPSDWNDTMADRAWTARHRIASPAKVLEIDQEAKSQTGVMVTLPTKAGGTIKLDAGWFKPLVEHDTGGGL